MSRRPHHLLRALVVALAVACAAPVAASASVFEDGDVFAGLANTGQYNVWDNEGQLKETISQTAPGGDTGNCAFNNAGVLHTTAFDRDTVVRFLAPHPHTRVTPDLTVLDQPRSISFARDGSFYVGHDPVVATAQTLRKFNGAGSFQANFDPAHSATLIDLASDQRTLFYTSQGSTGTTAVHRFDVAANVDLPDLVDLGQPALADLKLLPPGDGSGGLIVSHTTAIKRLSSTGAVVDTYDVPGVDNWFGVALDPDGRSFWAQSTVPGNVFRFNIETGVVDRGPLPASARAFGICVKGTRTAALDNAPPSIAIATPGDGATFRQGADVRASYSCEDDLNGTGIASCAGPVPPGAPIDTATTGTKSFEVVATDAAGNTATRRSTYTVTPPPPPPATGQPPAAPPAPPRPPQAERIQVTMAFAFDAPRRRSTRLTGLEVKEIPRGSVLRVSCRPPKRGQRCPARTVTRRDAPRTVKLRSFRRAFAAGTVIEARVTKPNAIGAVKLLTIRKGKRPTLATRCLPGGKGRPQAC